LPRWGTPALVHASSYPGRVRSSSVFCAYASSFVGVNVLDFARAITCCGKSTYANSCSCRIINAPASTTVIPQTCIQQPSTIRAVYSVQRALSLSLPLSFSFSPSLPMSPPTLYFYFKGPFRRILSLNRG